MFRRVIFYIGGMKGHTIEEDKFLLKRSINNSLKLLRVCFIRKKKKKEKKNYFERGAAFKDSFCYFAQNILFPKV